MAHAFSGNPVIPGKQAGPAAEAILARLAAESSLSLQILPFFQGKALVVAFESGKWRLSWQGIEGIAQSGIVEEISKNMVYLGEKEGLVYCAIDATPRQPRDSSNGRAIAARFEKNGGGEAGFVDLRTLMIAAEWTDEEVMGELSIAGHARALLEWHRQVQFCGRCGTITHLCDAGQRRRCSSIDCNYKLYPRIDPVVIMLVIDPERDRALLAHQPKYVPRMWSCLAGFIEPGESLEEAVRRETREETGVEVSNIVYHSSQPWPVGPGNMSCQLMVGFFAVATTFDIQVDKKELEDARWHSREDVQKALSNADYTRAQKATGINVYKTCLGEEMPGRNSSPMNMVAAGEGIFVPGPYAIAHHLISTWASQGSTALLSKI
ncbi:nudix hydrolase 19, chloroplastic [Selaginella moellendorffii]|nr:nudix hydrolase 19, chloroplastic [Selaginella moellendorffii]XP_024538671.1 nudix hydrolase 19, chloroplastic [Selaginella moellendorffii]|eukprot:XP_002977812.2 nudix hydrolase 19, chloroplastic [Selaginella moellendorffii]